MDSEIAVDKNGAGAAGLVDRPASVEVEIAADMDGVAVQRIVGAFKVAGAVERLFRAAYRAEIQPAESLPDKRREKGALPLLPL